MDLGTLINETYLTYRGKLSNVPAFGTEKSNRIVYLLNRKQREWARDANVDWPSRFEARDLGTVTSGTQTYDLDDDVMRLSDYVLLTDTVNSPNTPTYIKTIKPTARTRYYEGAYISGHDPQVLTFITTIGDNYDGYALTVPCFTMPDDMVSLSDVTSVDNPSWLINAAAAELARNDYAKADQYANIQGIANDLYQNMVTDAVTNGFLQPNGAMNNFPPTGDVWDGNAGAPWRVS